MTIFFLIGKTSTEKKMKDKYLLLGILFYRVSGDVMECGSLDLPLGWYICIF